MEWFTIKTSTLLLRVAVDASVFLYCRSDDHSPGGEFLGSLAQGRGVVPWLVFRRAE